MNNSTVSSLSAKVNLGLDLHRQGRFDEALVQFKSASKLAPKDSQIFYFIGICYLQTGDFKRAINFINKSIKIDDGQSEVWNNLGIAYRNQKDFKDAANAFERALALDPKLSASRYNLALSYKDLGEFEKALENMQEELGRQPSNPQLHFSLGNILHEAEHYEDAVLSLEKACELKPDYKEAWVNLGNNCKLIGAYDKASYAYDKALAIDPLNHAVAVNKGMILLQQGQYKEGWPLYERRIDVVDFQPDLLKKMSSPRWTGEDVKGKTVLIYAEQGLGDTIQFIRYASWVKSLGAVVILYIDKPLRALLASLSGVDQILVKGDAIPKHDYRVSVMSLPSVHCKIADGYECTVPYLEAKASLKEKWKERLGGGDKLKVGIVWQGNPDYVWDKFRSIALEEYLPLIENEAFDVYAMQVGDPKNQVKKLLKNTPALKDKITDIGELIKKEGASFDDTAAIVSQLDVLVSSDTSMTHLAGALGIPVCTALNVVPDWRWRSGTITADYYPSMKLYRQTKRRDWKPVFEHINNDLMQMYKDKK